MHEPYIFDQCIEILLQPEQIWHGYQPIVQVTVKVWLCLQAPVKQHLAYLSFSLATMPKKKTNNNDLQMTSAKYKEPWLIWLKLTRSSVNSLYASDPKILRHLWWLCSEEEKTSGPRVRQKQPVDTSKIFQNMPTTLFTSHTSTM